MKKLSLNQTMYAYIIGIDVSKESLDVCMIDTTTGEYESKLLTNTKEGYLNMKRWMKRLGNDVECQSLFCMEHTGIYTRNLVKYLLSRGCKVWMESSLHIKRSMGLVRGKSDKIDAERIAMFAYTHQKDAKLVQLTSSTLDRLQYLMRTRVRLMKSRESQEKAIKEMETFDKKAGREMRSMSRQALTGLKNSIEKVEAKMLELVSIDKEVRALYELITSVKSVGKVLAIDLIVYTHGFSRMLDGRKLACYCGVAPFEYQSGTSVFAPAGTSKFANKVLKSHLHMASMNAIRCHEELRNYYLRKVEEGKGKMSAINAVRNKLLHRVVAVVKRGTPYIEKLDKK
jgi:transposase